MARMLYLTTTMADFSSKSCHVFIWYCYYDHMTSFRIETPTVVRKYDMIIISTPFTQCGPGGQSDEYHIPDHHDGQTHF